MQPNIVCIVTDQLTPLLMGCYGHPVVKTPHLDRMVAEGVRFDSAYSPCPVCAPARAALMSGRYISEIGAWDNAALFPADVPTFAHYLTNAGYECVLSGKMHFVGPDQLHGYHRRLTTDIYPSDFSWTRTRAWEGTPMWPPHGMTGGYVADGVGPRTWSDFLAYDAATHFKALEFLRRRRLSAEAKPIRPDRTPFHLTVSYHHPHEPFNPPREFWDLYENEDIPIPDIPEDLEPFRTTMDRWLHRFHGLHTRDITDPQSLRALQRAYFALVTYVDHLVGELIAELEAMHLLDSTVIAFTSDHGEMLGARGMIQKRTFYEQAARVPLILRFPDGRGAGRRVGTPTSLIDLAPTFAQIAGVPAELMAPTDGASLLPLCDGGNDANLVAERIVFGEYHSEGVYGPCFMARQGRHKLVLIHGGDGPERRLFDLETDPLEWNDLSEQPDHRAVARALEAAILDRFDPQEIEARVRASIARRMVIDPAMKAQGARWDYTACEGGSARYVRPTEPVPEARSLPWTTS